MIQIHKRINNNFDSNVFKVFLYDMEAKMSLDRFARLVTMLHKEGLDLKLIDIGTTLVEKMTVDETIQTENDLADVRMMLSKRCKESVEEGFHSDHGESLRN